MDKETAERLIKLESWKDTIQEERCQFSEHGI